MPRRPLSVKETLLMLLALGEYIDDGSIDSILRWLAARIASCHRSHGGSTIGWDGAPVTSGYAVATHDHAKTIDGNLTDEQILDYLRRYWRGMVADDYMLGTWFFDGRSHLAFTCVKGTLEEAMALGLTGNQQYIRDLAKKENIRVLPTMPYAPVEPSSRTMFIASASTDDVTVPANVALPS